MRLLIVQLDFFCLIAAKVPKVMKTYESFQQHPIPHFQSRSWADEIVCNRGAIHLFSSSRRNPRPHPFWGDHRQDLPAMADQTMRWIKRLVLDIQQQRHGTWFSDNKYEKFIIFLLHDCSLCKVWIVHACESFFPFSFNFYLFLFWKKSKHYCDSYVQLVKRFAYTVNGVSYFTSHFTRWAKVFSRYNADQKSRKSGTKSDSRIRYGYFCLYNFEILCFK